MKTYSALLMIAILVESLYAQAELAGANETQTILAKNASAQSQNSKVDTPKDTKNSVSYPFPYFKAGDAIKISVYPDSTFFLNGLYNIDQNGNVDLPILGLVSVTDKTRNEFIDLLKNEFSDYLRYPNINITPYMRVSFFGGFFKPGLYWVDSRSSLWEAIQIAGGVNREDGLKNIRWERDGYVISRNIIRDFQAGTSLQKMGFQSGDQLCVTVKPRMQFWDSFKEDVIPVLSFSLTALTTALTAYQTYKIYQDYND